MKSVVFIFISLVLFYLIFTYHNELNVYNNELNVYNNSKLLEYKSLFNFKPIFNIEGFKDDDCKGLSDDEFHDYRMSPYLFLFAGESILISYQ